mmetsp:Transcript_22160/g.33499  ORF Transcript_22160/g.33499 Transcript_22160/m.33499 type:complete len:290 (+) Transcript_22160:210-1079(+)
MSKKRPGYEAAKRLSETINTTNDDKDDDETDSKILQLWTDIEAKLPDVLSSITDLSDLTSSRQQIIDNLVDAAKNKNEELSLSKEELFTVVKWKFAVGKTRNALWPHFKSNTEKNVRAATKVALGNAHANIADDEAIKQAVTDLTKRLAGVGPATASAILSMISPCSYCYMYDEVIDCFSSKRTYSLKEYLAVNEGCANIALSLSRKQLKKDLKERIKCPRAWTSFRVSQTLWVAARICAAGGDLGDDLTLKAAAQSNKSKKRESAHYDEPAPATSSKRQRKSGRRKRS